MPVMTSGTSESAKWKGNGNFLLETFANKHRQANEMLKSAVVGTCSFMGGLGYCCPNPQKGPYTFAVLASRLLAGQYRYDGSFIERDDGPK